VGVQTNEAIGSHLSDKNVLCTDAWRAFSSYANSKGLAITVVWKNGWTALMVLQANLIGLENADGIEECRESLKELGVILPM